MTHSVLLVEDDERIRLPCGSPSRTRATVERGGGRARTPSSPSAPSHPDVVLIDIMLPGIDGFEVCRPIRRTQRRPDRHGHRPRPTPTTWSPASRRAPTTTSPSRSCAKELSARIRALLRRAAAPATGLHRLALRRPRDPSPTRARCCATATRSTSPRPSSGCCASWPASPGRVFSREALLDRVWGYDYFGDGRLVDVHVRRLRTKVEATRPTPARRDRARAGLPAAVTEGFRRGAAATGPASSPLRSPDPCDGGLRPRGPVPVAHAVGDHLRAGPALPLERADLGGGPQSYVNALAFREAVKTSKPDPRRALVSLDLPTGSVPSSGSADPLVRLLAGGRSRRHPCRPAPDRHRRGPPGPGAVPHGETELAVGVPIPASNAVYFELFSMAELDRTLQTLALVLSATAAITTVAAIGIGHDGPPAGCCNRCGASPGRPPTSRGGRLDTRLDVGVDRDLAGLASSFNSMVDALAGAIERDARFASDVSHELRSPLTTLTTALSVLESAARAARPVPAGARPPLGRPAPLPAPGGGPARDLPLRRRSGGVSSRTCGSANAMIHAVEGHAGPDVPCSDRARSRAARGEGRKSAGSSGSSPTWSRTPTTTEAACWGSRVDRARPTGGGRHRRRRRRTGRRRPGPRAGVRAVRAHLERLAGDRAWVSRSWRATSSPTTGRCG